jgi:hypothetical protein
MRKIKIDVGNIDRDKQGRPSDLGGQTKVFIFGIGTLDNPAD